MRRRAGALFAALVLAGASLAHAASADDALAAERRYRTSGSAADGLAAVSAWRAAGRYARARVLLEEVRERAGRDLPEAAPLAARLDELTGTLRLDGVNDDARISVDGAAPERLGDQLVLDVGARQIIVDAPGCEAEHLHVSVRPRARLHERLELRCAKDDEVSAPRARPAHPGFRARRIAAYVGPFLVADPSGASAGGELGVVLTRGPVWLAAGASLARPLDGTDATSYGADARVNLSAPLYQGSFDDYLVGVDVTPFAFAYRHDDEQLSHVYVGALTLAADHVATGLRWDATLWPAGFAAYRGANEVQRTEYAAALELRFFWTVGP